MFKTKTTPGVVFDPGGGASTSGRRARQGVDTQPVLVTSVLPPFTAFRGYLHV